MSPARGNPNVLKCWPTMSHDSRGTLYCSPGPGTEKLTVFLNHHSTCREIDFMRTYPTLLEHQSDKMRYQPGILNLDFPVLHP